MGTVRNKQTGKEKELRRYFSNPQVSACDCCGLTYDEFETGETYQSVYDTLWKGSEDPSEWLNKGRHTVLGRWHEIKQDMWRDHLKQCEEMQEGGQEFEPIDESEFLEY